MTAPVGPEASAKDRLIFLDYLRIFAFASVLAGHKFSLQLTALSTNTDVHVTLRYLARGLMPLTWGGGAGVMVFFLVSGYIITHVLRWESPLTFAVKRAFRIYPLYWTALLLEGILVYGLIGNALPPFSVWLPRLFLLGDFFGTPNSLGDVEWTLRIEILFYAFMLLCRLAIFPKHARFLPALYVATTIALQWTGPFPASADWTNGLVTLYLPMLFVGSILYLMEKGLAAKGGGIASILWILGTYLVTEPQLNRAGMESNFVAYALLLFLLAWGFRRVLPDGRIIRLLSGLTFGVYLLHNWAWDFLGAKVDLLGLPGVPREVQILIALLAVCAVLHYTVERHGIRLGARLLRRIAGARSPAPPVAPAEVK